MGIHPVTIVVFVVVLLIGLLLGIGLQSVIIGGVVCAFAVLLLIALRVARQWQKAVVLRLGKYQGLKGPGLFYIVPFVDTIPYWTWMPSSSGVLSIQKRRRLKLKIIVMP